MFKQLKAITVAGAMALAFVASVPAFSQSSAPRSFSDDGPQGPQFIFNAGMARTMDKNKDGMVSRAEYLDYMGAQFDIMDAKKKGMLTMAEFTNKQMMDKTFPRSLTASTD